mgnify:CR=1 FL=1
MANDKDPVFCAADIIKRAKLAKEFKNRQRTCRLSGYITLHTEQLERPQQHRLPPAVGQPGRRGLQLAADGKGLACTSFKIL